MKRKKTLEGGTREKILDAAQEVFMENGYENSSVRTILEKAEVVTGSFYHFFASKEELFEEVISQYLIRYAQRIAVITRDETTTFIQKMSLILNATEESTGFYCQKLDANRLHWTMQYALHKKTMMAIWPEVEQLICRVIAENKATNPLQMDSKTLSAVVLQGIEGILHARPIEEINKEQIVRIKRDVIAYVTMVMGLTE